MTRRKFRDLLLIYLVVAILGAAYGLYVGVSGGRAAAELLSKESFTEELKEEMQDFYRYMSERQSIKSTISTVSIVLVILSWIGLFKFWKPARILFCAYLFVAYAVSPFLDIGLDGLSITSELYGFYCSLLMERPGAVAQILATINIAFDTAIVLIVFSAYGSSLFNNVQPESHT